MVFPFFDFSTALVGYLIAATLGAIIVGMLWRQAREREPATTYWFAGGVLHLGSIILFGLRGHVPDFVPIIGGGLLVVGAAILMRNGLARFLNRSTHPHGMLLVFFLMVHVYFTWVEPSIRVRNMNLSFAQMLISAESFFLLRRWAPAQLRPASTLFALTTSTMSIASLGVVIFFASVGQQWIGVSAQGQASAIVLLIYQVFAVTLPVAAVLLVNRRLFNDNARELIDHQRSEAALRLSEARLQRAELTAKVGNWEMDIKARTFDTSVGCEAIYEGKKEDYDYATMRAIPLPEYRPIIDAALKRSAAEGVPYETEFKIRSLDTGTLKDIHSRGNYDPVRGIVFGVIQDVTEQKTADEKLRLAASVFSHAAEGIMILDLDSVILDANAAVERITGYDKHEIIGRNIGDLNPPELPEAEYQAAWTELRKTRIWDGEMMRRRKNGELYTIHVTISAVPDAAGIVTHYVALFSDISELKQQQRQMQKMAHYDALTSLPNRSLLADRLQQAIAQSQRRNLPLALAFLDLDGFKAVNDQHGHTTGDALLVELAARMKHALREGDTLARVGGDEFIAILGDLRDDTECTQVLQRLLDAASAPLLIGTLTLQVSASIGVTLYPQDYVDADMLIRHADQTMYLAKQSGKNRYRFFGDEP